MSQKLVLVYNADEGFAAMIIDAVHKVMKPETYECSLCMISYGSVAMRGAWRKYLDSLPMEKAFYHKQDFERAYPNNADTRLPAIMLDQGVELQMLLDNKDLDEIGDVDELIATMKEVLKEAA